MAQGKPKKVTRPKQVSDAAILRAIEKYHGIKTSVAKACRISRQALHKRIVDSEEMQKAIEDSKEVVLDGCESMAYKLALAGDTQMLRLILSTKGKSRGFGNSVNLSGSVETTGTVTVLELPSNGR